MARHIIPMGSHTPLRSSWINEVPDLDTKVPLVYRLGQEQAMADAFAKAKRDHKWSQLRSKAKQIKSNIGPNIGDKK